MHYQPLTENDKQTILREIGVDTFEDLLRGIPASLRNPSMPLPEALPEVELQRLFKQIAGKNEGAHSMLSFLGGGSYEHFIPAAVQSVIGRHEFYTAYTPYQPEASQGSLQAIFEFQSLITELVGLDVSNASHYDGATSLAEASLMALRHTGRSKLLISQATHPHYRQVLRTYLEGTSFQAEEIPFDPSKGLSRSALMEALTDQVGAVVLQTPNFFGVIEDLEGVAERVHELGALLILAVNPISLGVLKTPGEWGADIAVGEGQPLGIPAHLGGPYLGLFTVTRALMRKIPGRLAGMTKDAQGRRTFCLTLQAREQHIRREKASSNICTNQALCALAACVYMTLMGKEGIRKVGELNMDRAAYLRQQIGTLKQFQVEKNQPIFNEFVVRAQKSSEEIQTALRKQGILGGIALSRFYPQFKNEFLVCATETKTRRDLDRFVEALAQC